MALLVLFTIWFVLGIIIGALALAARLVPPAWGRAGWLWMLALGAGAALPGGLLATWLAGRVFATPAALWIAVLATAAPWIVAHLRIFVSAKARAR